MKRMISYLLVTVIMLGVLVGCDAAPKEVEEYTFPDAEYAVNATDMAVVGDKIYYISDEKVYETASDIVVFGEFPAQFLASNGKELAVYGNGQVWCGEETYTVPQSEISSFVYADSTFCWSYMEGDLPQIGFYNIKSGETISVSPLSGVECRAIPYHGANIMILCSEIDGYSVMYDYNTESMKPGAILVHDIIRSCAYNSQNNSFVYINSTGKNSARIKVLMNETGDEKQYSPCEMMRDGIDRFIFSGGTAIFTDKAGTIFVRENFVQNELQNSVTVIVNGMTDYFGRERITELSETIFELYGIEVIIDNQTDSNKITQKLLAGDDDFDLFFPNGYHIVLDYPIYEPLNHYPIIMEQFDAMLDEIKDICTYKGDVFGVPTRADVSNSVWGYHSELLDKLGLELPSADWTMDDFYELAKQVREGGAYIASYSPLWSSLYATHFGNSNTSEGLSDDGTALRKMLEINKKLRSEGLLYNPDTAPADAEVLFFSDNSSLSFITTECDVWYIPTFDGTRVDNSYLSFLQMNVNSKNKEEAAQVIAEFMKQQSTDYPTIGWTFYKDTAEALQGSSEKSARNIEIYKNLLASASPHPNYLEFNLFADEHEQKYYNDEQDLEYTADQIYARAKMIFEE